MKHSLALVVATLFFATVSAPASAYIDSGTGSMFLQAAVSGVLGALFVFRGFWANLATHLGLKTKPAGDRRQKNTRA